MGRRKRETQKERTIRHRRRRKAIASALRLLPWAEHELAAAARLTRGMLKYR